MKRSVKTCLAMSAAVMCADVPDLRGNFILSLTLHTSGADETIVLRALNDGLNGTGTALQAMDVTVTTLGNTTSTALKFNYTDLDGDGIPDPNPIGQGLDFGSTAGTFLRIGPYNTFVSPILNPPNILSPGVAYPPGYDPVAAYSNLHALEIAGIDTSASGVPANTGSGAPFANIVVPIGTIFTISGQLGGEIGQPQNFSYDNTFELPKPLVSFTAASAGAPAGLGGKIGKLSVTGALAQLTGLNNIAGLVEVMSFTPATDPEIFALDIAVDGAQATAAQIAEIIAQINAGASLGQTPIVSATSPVSLFPGNYNLFLIYPTPASADNYFGFSMANLYGVPDATVTAVAVVPEPASTAVLILGTCAGLRPRRRRIS